MDGREPAPASELGSIVSLFAGFLSVILAIFVCYGCLHAAVARRHRRQQQEQQQQQQQQQDNGQDSVDSSPPAHAEVAAIPFQGKLDESPSDLPTYQEAMEMAET